MLLHILFLVLLLHRGIRWLARPRTRGGAGRRGGAATSPTPTATDLFFTWSNGGGNASLSPPLDPIISRFSRELPCILCLKARRRWRGGSRVGRGNPQTARGLTGRLPGCSLPRNEKGELCRCKAATDETELAFAALPDTFGMQRALLPHQWLKWLILLWENSAAHVFCRVSHHIMEVSAKFQ